MQLTGWKRAPEQVQAELIYQTFQNAHKVLLALENALREMTECGFYKEVTVNRLRATGVSQTVECLREVMAIVDDRAKKKQLPPTPTPELAIKRVAQVLDRFDKIYAGEEGQIIHSDVLKWAVDGYFQ